MGGCGVIRVGVPVTIVGADGDHGELGAHGIVELLELGPLSSTLADIPSMVWNPDDPCFTGGMLQAFPRDERGVSSDEDAGSLARDSEHGRAFVGGVASLHDGLTHSAYPRQNQLHLPALSLGQHQRTLAISVAGLECEAIVGGRLLPLQGLVHE